MRHFIKNSSGNAIIEFAVVAPMLFILLAGIIELGLIMFTNSALEGATNIGARIGKTGFSSSGTSREQYIRSEIKRLSGGFVNNEKLTISILAYNSFSNIGQPEPCLKPALAPCPGKPTVNFIDINGNGIWDEDQGTASAGGSGAVVIYRTTYPWRLFTPFMSSLIGKNGTYSITAVSAVRNEKIQ